jgi:glycosyltransferase involved in cell wall biosynthesis
LLITANHVRLKEIIEDNINGLSFEAGNEKELADKISYCINNQNNIKDIGEKGKKTYKENITDEIFIKRMMRNIYLNDMINYIFRHYVASY